jgi:hypothetical protein
MTNALSLGEGVHVYGVVAPSNSKVQVVPPVGVYP